ncbi:hypothetical protein GCM10022402_23670 [Salinactinospora qingdaonensis]|uniref:Uncharacterized protein n=1 Tax=Salinactinospora qingdaonensis TaxID=702744 RepID=A0ABP7FT69_9ACTN
MQLDSVQPQRARTLLDSAGESTPHPYAAGLAENGQPTQHAHLVARHQPSRSHRRPVDTGEEMVRMSVERVAFLLKRDLLLNHKNRLTDREHRGALLSTTSKSHIQHAPSLRQIRLS